MSLPAIPQDGIGGASLREAAATEFRAVIDMVVRAVAAVLYPGQPDRYVEFEAMFPDRAVVRRDGRLYAYPYTIDEQNQVQLGQPDEVVEDYRPLREAVHSAFVEAAGDSGKWLIRVIRSGLSLNNVFYPDAVLREAVGLFEGARVFVKSDQEHVKGDGKDVRNLIGRLTEAKFMAGAMPDCGEVRAKLELIQPDGPVAVQLREAYGRGMAGLFGFSIDADGAAKIVVREGKRVRVASVLSKVNSVDLIVEPGAGGQLIRLVESVHTGDTDMALRDQMLATIREKAPDKAAALGDAPSEEQILTAYREAVAPAPAAPAGRGEADLSAVDERLRMIEARASMRASIAASNLPQPAKDRLTADFERRERFVEADVTAAIQGERDYLAKFTESGKPNTGFAMGLDVEDRPAKVAGMLDAFFDPAHKNHRAAGSFKECYIEITGDRRVTGRLQDCDLARLRESLGASFRESLDSTSFADALGNSITRRMQVLYTGQTDLQAWRKVATIGRANDFRTQERVRIGGYGNLPIVGESDPYSPLASPGDDKATYAIAKRGGTEDVTLEMIKNDDVGAIMRIPLELALSAANTLYEFVFDFFRTNPNAWDGVALYHASHSNLFTGALSAAEYSTHRLSMQKQTRSGSGKRMASAPAVLLVPFDLQETAFNLFVRNQNLDKTFIQTVNPDVVTVDYWTDVTDWVTVANKDRFPILEVAFLDGNEEPELFTQDLPNVGSMFSNDKLTYKIRHIYGGNLLVDAEKGTTKAVVAG